jgi:hypothetical protein
MQEIITTFWHTFDVAGIAICELNSEFQLFTKRRLLAWEKQAILQAIHQNLNEYAQNANHSHFTVMGNYARIYIEFPFTPLIILTQSDNFIPPSITDLQIALKQNYQQVITIFERLANSNIAQQAHKLSAYASHQNSELESVTMQELINALNHLIVLCTKYMGQTMTIKYLEKSRPKNDWLSNFQVTKSNQVMFVGNPQQKLDQTQKILVKQWVKEFLRESSCFFASLPILLKQSGLTDKQKSILLI